MSLAPTVWRAAALVLPCVGAPAASPLQENSGVESGGLALQAASDVDYRESLRPPLHFTSERNWLNDPNGMVHDGEGGAIVRASGGGAVIHSAESRRLRSAWRP